MKWISVKDKLPPVGLDVLTYIYNKNCPYPQPNSLRWDNIYYISIERRLKIIQDDILLETKWSSVYEVLFWMPLPDKPDDLK